MYVDRLHSDKARELVESKQIQKWCAARGLLQTTTGGDNPSSNEHVESEVNQLKRRTRLLLRQAGLSATSWPIALRHAAEDRLRHQLEGLGVPQVPMIDFHANVLVKRKRWHGRGPLAPPFVEATLLCPSPVMNQGWSVRTQEGQVLHVREAVVPCEDADNAALALHEHARPPMILEPSYRIHGKQRESGGERAGLVDGLNGENSVGDDENVDDEKFREDGDGWTL